MLLLGVVLTVLVIDQLSKFVVRSTMTELQSIPLIPHVFHLTYVENPGAAFSMLAHHTSFFIVVTAIAVMISVYFYFKVNSQRYLLRIGIALQLGGSLGNLIDRVRIGRVVDFFDFRIWPVFNIADSAIVVGVALICWELLKPAPKEQNGPVPGR